MARGLLIIKTLTPTHPGAGTSLGAIDLMLQREVTTNFPFIQGSSLKGAMRSHLHSALPDNEKSVLDAVFGPRDAGGSDLSRGALIVSDASLLFYPVRTLKGLYALVTCPEVLRRLNMPHIGLKVPDSILTLSDKGKVKTSNSTKSKYAISGKVYFEDLNFSVDTISDGDFNWINEKLGLDEGIKSRLFIVHYDVFQYFVEFSAQVVSRNKIDYDTGTVDKKIGGIWTEEHLPPETYLFSYLEDNGKVVGKIKVKENNLGKEKDASSFEWVADKLNNNVIHLGGDETVGKGFAELRFKKLQEAKNG
ncbi:MAG: type III-B CRISPR module RAMP protein Cmr4 [Candidatus Hydrothermota bacterium]|nr:MAG: type III-B CRISPR module RAMP protein Cmr4 [Candidatus Hydrothermae bacterium]